MAEQIRYRLLMRRLRREIARMACDEKQTDPKKAEKMKTRVATACKACGSIV